METLNVIRSGFAYSHFPPDYALGLPTEAELHNAVAEEEAKVREQRSAKGSSHEGSATTTKTDSSLPSWATADETVLPF